MKKIIFEREKCIGCGNCSLVCPDYWKMGEDGKSNLKDSQKNEDTGNFEKIVEEVGCNEMAEKDCPAFCIHIKEE